jgi:predicted AAA+ superfamily ATPase
MLTRQLSLNLPQGQSAFLWGPRQVGKSTLLREQFPNSIYLDLLDSQLRFPLLQNPRRLREFLAAYPPENQKFPIIVDEVQKVPEILDEIHWLIENRRLAFLLCGSSARKLRRGQANLLGGRAWRFELHPLVFPEIPEFDLLRVLRHGLLPAIHLAAEPRRALEAYVYDYLREEIAAEALTKNLAAFSSFLQLVGITNGQLVNYSRIASDVGVDAKTVKSYFQILEDTLLGRFLPAFPAKPGSRKNLASTPKFYLFDPGVARTLAGVDLLNLKGAEAGHLLETFIAHEIHAWLSYNSRRDALHFYRTHEGAEIDFVLTARTKRHIAIECKLSTDIRARDLSALNPFLAAHPRSQGIVVCLEPAARQLDSNLRILPVRDFLTLLWSGKLVPR